MKTRGVWFGIAFFVLLFTCAVLAKSYIDLTRVHHRTTDRLETLQDSLGILHELNDSTVSTWSRAVESERELRREAEDVLNLKLRETVHSLVQAELQIAALQDSLSVSGASGSDTLQPGYVRFWFDPQYAKRPGYEVEWTPSVSLPVRYSVDPDSVTVTADIETRIDPFTVRVAITEEEGEYRAIVQSSSPLFDRFARVESSTLRRSPSFWDRASVSAFAGFGLEGLVYAGGIGYDAFRLQVQGGHSVSLLIGAETSLAGLWPF